MDYEKAYKDALERAVKIHSKERVTGIELVTCEGIFPELRESEDEKIRKSLITLIKEIKLQPLKRLEDWDGYIAWLEKQGEQKPIERDTETHDLWVYIREWNEKFGRLPKDEDELAACIDYVKKRQKPIDKVESKFKVGDWILIDRPCRIELIDDNGDYVIQYYDSGTKSVFSKKFCETHFHLWNIEDAKDGDVLAAYECYAIFKEIDDLNIKRYCTYHCMNNPMFFVNTLQNKTAFQPATKEQRELLFSKMKEAGYEWDAEKKELTKIEQASAWSEEDEKIINDAIWLIEHYATDGNKKLLREQTIDKLKSLKPNHWKPSEEQMEALVRCLYEDIHQDKELYVKIESLYNDIKTL